MADTLSQEEIDSLLRAVTKGEVSVEEIKKEEEKAKVKSYDFRRPMKFSKDHTRTFQMIHENFARSLSTYLSGRLRFFVDVSLGPIEQITYGEFLKSVPNPTYMAIFTGSSLNGSAILEINQTIIFGMIDRILGGAGMSITKSRSLTEIETNIVRRETMRFLTLLRDAWVNVMEFVPEIENTESNPQFVQIAPINDMTLLITMEIMIGTIEGFMNICIPTSVVEPFTEKITNQFWFSSSEKKEKEELTPKIARNLQNTPISLQAILGKTRLSVGELLYLQ
ncbi:MAG TPA: flagellar motor switch protein FliM, partial [Thermotogota bacterium]|nr:flagellar motor switch protein FliM [Thermotogota bacterium]